MDFCAHLVLVARRAALLALLLALSGCVFKSRPPMSDEELLAKQNTLLQIVEQRRGEMYVTLGHRMRAELQHAVQTGEPQTLDILMLSGGGDYGAFGAGVLAGWGEISDPALSRPQFDFVTGVSTGALIAPYAFIGTDEAIGQVLHMYENPDKNWLKSQTILRILRFQDSIYNVKGLHKAIHDNMTAEMADAIAEGVADNRLLLAGATSLDFGVFTPFNLGLAFTDAARIGDRTRPVNMMLASSAIPGGFPAIEIDEFLFVDGGASVQMFIPTDRAAMYADELWLAQEFQGHKPKIRVWAIVNNKLVEPARIVQPRLGSVVGRSLGISIRSSALLTLRDLETLGNVLRAKGGDIEFRYLSVPQDFVDSPGGAFFDKDTMRRLSAVGREMGRDPASWRVHVPSVEWPNEMFDDTGRKSIEQLRQEGNSLITRTNGG